MSPLDVRNPADRTGTRVSVDHPPAALGAGGERRAVEQQLVEELQEDQQADGTGHHRVGGIGRGVIDVDPARGLEHLQADGAEQRGPDDPAKRHLQPGQPGQEADERHHVDHQPRGEGQDRQRGVANHLAFQPHGIQQPAGPTGNDDRHPDRKQQCRP